MIESKIVKISKPKIIDNLYIERELSKQFESVIRWAIVDIDKKILVSVSYYR